MYLCILHRTIFSRGLSINLNWRFSSLSEGAPPLPFPHPTQIFVWPHIVRSHLLGFCFVQTVAILIQSSLSLVLYSRISRVRNVQTETTVLCWRRSLVLKGSELWSLSPPIIVSRLKNIKDAPTKAAGHYILSPDILFGKISGRFEVLPDKTDFSIFHFGWKLGARIILNS